MNISKKIIELQKDFKYADIKPWFLSRTIWINVVAIAALILQAKYGFIICAEEQAAALVIINLLLRAVTKKELTK